MISQSELRTLCCYILWLQCRYGASSWEILKTHLKNYMLEISDLLSEEYKFFFHWLERLHKYPTHPPLVLEFRSLCPMHLKTWEDNIPCGGEEYNVVQIKRSKRVRCFQCTIFEIFDG